MSILLFSILVLFACFALVVFFGAPYLPTLSPQRKAALDLANLQTGDHLYELGCGDGSLVLEAAKRGIRVTGIELNPVLALIAFIRTRHYRSLVSIRVSNFWRVSLADADAIFVFLLPKYMKKLDNKITQESRKNVKLISFAFKVHRKPIKAELDGVFLYEYAAATDLR